MANEKNLKPFKKGQSGNPKGRPKGSLDSATIIRKWLEAKSEYTNPITKKKELGQLFDEVVIGLIAKARKGDARAFEALLDRAEGRVTQKHEIKEAPKIKLKIDRGSKK